MKKTPFLLVLALFVVFVQACGNGTAKSEPNSQPAAQNQTSPQPQSETAVPAPSEFKEIFTGSIDDKRAIRMELERKGAEMSGGYFYERAGAFNVALKTLELKGRIDGDGNVTLTETGEDSKAGAPRKTGEFKGKLDGLSANGVVRLGFTGLWTGAGNRKQMPFSLRQLQFNLGGLKLEEKKEKSSNKKPRYEIDAAFPHLAGPHLSGEDSARVEKFNLAVAKLAASSAGEFKKAAAEAVAPEQGPSLNVSYEIIAANKDFISVLFNFSEYMGGAHPSSTTQSLNYDLNRNAVVNLADLFTPNSNYLKVISDYSIKELKKLETVSFADEGAGPKLENFHSWNITPAGLKITFDPYQVGPYAAGEHEVVVPYSVLNPIIKPDGLLGQFAK